MLVEEVRSLTNDARALVQGIEEQLDAERQDQGSSSSTQSSNSKQSSSACRPVFKLNTYITLSHIHNTHMYTIVVHHLKTKS